MSPPDLPARRRILELALEDRPEAGLDLDGLARRTALFSGADLRSLVERAVDAVIDEAIERGDDVPIRDARLERALRDARATTTDRLRTARNHVELPTTADATTTSSPTSNRRSARRRASASSSSARPP